MHKNYSDQPQPMFQPANLHYQMSEWNRAIGFGDIGSVHTLDARKHRLKRPETVLGGFPTFLAKYAKYGLPNRPCHNILRLHQSSLDL